MRLYIFDMGEVLMLGVDTLRQMAKEYGIEYKDLRADYALYDMALMDGYMSPYDYYRHLEDKYEIKISDDPFVKYFNPVLNFEIFPLIDELRIRGDRTAIGSNTFAPHWDMLENRYSELKKHFDALYASHIIHMSKPNTAFWQMILEREGVSARDAYFIDDRTENIESAKSMGIKCFEYHRNNEELKAFLGL